LVRFLPTVEGKDNPTKGIQYEQTTLSTVLLKT